MRRWAPTLLALSLLSMTGCSLFKGVDRLGVSEGPDGGVRIHFVPCPGQVVTRVALIAGDEGGFSAEVGNDEPADDEDENDRSVWQIAAPDGSPERVFDVGVTPAGFVEELPLQGSPETLTGLGAFVGYGNGASASIQIGFDADDLTEESIQTLEGQKDPATFERDGLASCHED